MMLRTLRKNFAQFIAIIAIGAIAVTLFTGLLSNADVFQNQVDKVYANGNLASLWVTTQKYDKEDKTNIESFLEEGEKVEERLYLPAKGQSHSFYLTVVKEMPSISKPYAGSVNYEDKDFLYIDQSIADEIGTNIKVGSNISLSFDISSYKEQSNGMISFLDKFLKDGGTNIFKEDTIVIKPTITGTMNYPENINKASYQSGVLLMSDSVFKKEFKKLFTDNFKEEYVEILFNSVSSMLGFNKMDSDYFTNPNQYLIQSNNEERTTVIDKKIEEYFSKKENNNLLYSTTRSQMPFYITINNDVTQARQFTFVFPMVFFLVAVLVILTTLSQIVLKDRNQIGTLKAIGISKGKIYFLYISLTFSLVFLATLIGEIIGPLLIPNILGQKYQITYSLPNREYSFPWLYCILTAIVFLFVSSLVTFLICHREVSLKPSESMRPKVVKMKKISKSKKVKTKASFFSFKMAIRNIFLNKAKSLMVVLGVTGCTALLVCGFGIEDTVYHGIDNDVELFRSQDITLTLSTNKTKQELTNDFSSMEEVEYIETSLSSTCTVYKEGGNRIDTTIYVIEDNPKLMKVDFPIDSIAIAEKTANSASIKEGDTISFQYNNTVYSCKVSVVYQAFFYNGIMVHDGNKIFKDKYFTFQSLAITLKSGTDVSKFKEKCSKYSYVSSMMSKDDWQDRISNVMSGVIVMTNAVKIFAILLGIVVLYNLTLMNFKDRSRDMATLKVLGFSRMEILKSMLFESLALTHFGVICGMALGYPFMLACMMTNKVELVEYLYFIKPLSYFLSFLLTFGVAFIINLILAKRTDKIKMVESLKSVE